MDAQMIQAEPRTSKGSKAAQRLRQQGRVPAVLYGHGEENLMLTVSSHDLDFVLQHGVRVLDLEIAGTSQKVMIKDVQFDAMGDVPVHVDFTRVVIGEKIRLKIPIELVGVAQGVVVGGILDHPVSDIEIECLPTAIPEKVRVSIKELQVGDMLTVGALILPEGVTVLTDPAQIVATVHPPVKEVELEAPVESAAPVEPEVIGAKEREEAAKKAEAEKE